MSYISTVTSILRPYAIPLLTTAGTVGIYLSYRCIHCVKKCFSDRHRRRIEHQEVGNFTKNLFDRVAECVVEVSEIDEKNRLVPYNQAILRSVGDNNPSYIGRMNVSVEPWTDKNGAIHNPVKQDGLRTFMQIGALVPFPEKSLGFLLTSKKLIIRFTENNPLQGLFTPYRELEELFEDIEKLFALLEHSFAAFKDKGLSLLSAQVKEKEQEDQIKLERRQNKRLAKGNKQTQYQKPAFSIIRFLEGSDDLFLKKIKEDLNQDIEFCRMTRKSYEFCSANKWQTYLLYEHILDYFKDMLSHLSILIDCRSQGIKLSMRENRFIISFVDKYIPHILLIFKNWYFILRRIYPYACEACKLLDIELLFININKLDCSETFKGALHKFDREFNQKEKRARKAARRKVCESKAFDFKHGHGTDQEYGFPSTASSSWTKLKKKSKKLPTEPALSSVQKTKVDIEKARAEKEESEKVKAEARKEDNLRKYRLIAPHQFSIKIVPALFPKNRETLHTLYGMNGSYDHRITNQDIVALANDIRVCIKREFQGQFTNCTDQFIGSLRKFTDEVERRDHLIHEGHGKKLPASYVDIRRSTFIRYGLWPTGWGPNNEKENEDQQIYFERAIATVFGHEGEEEREEVEEDEETEIE